jgi:hypothetical protein
VDPTGEDPLAARLTWTVREGDAASIPMAPIVATQAGFSALEDPGDGTGSSRYWVSRDGIEWATAALPVPAETTLEQAVVNGRSWMWASDEFRLWGASGTDDWTEIDLSGIKPPPIDGITWTFGPVSVRGVADITIMTWEVWGRLDLAGLLRIDVPAGGSVGLDPFRRGLDPGTPREVLLFPSQGEHTVVGRYTIEVSGPIVSVIDADRGATVATIDSTLIGSTSDVAQSLIDNGTTPGPGRGIRIVDGRASSLTLPEAIGLTSAFGPLLSAEGRFVLYQMRVVGDAGTTIQPKAWTSSDGATWSSGPVQFPTEVDGFDLKQDDATGQVFAIGRPLDTLREELWTSGDGLSWTGRGSLPSVQGIALQPVPLGTDGFLAFPRDENGDFETYASSSGDQWTDVSAASGADRSRAGEATPEAGATPAPTATAWPTRVSVTPDATFVMLEGSDGSRTLWRITAD